jgi:hypothetical protein
MRTRYMEATKTCLEGDSAGSLGDSGDRRDPCYMLFKNLVMHPIPLVE